MRATTPEQKRVVIERLYECWLKQPELRLGQLIVNATYEVHQRSGDIFYVEDEELVKLVEDFVK